MYYEYLGMQPPQKQNQRLETSIDRISANKNIYSFSSTVVNFITLPRNLISLAWLTLGQVCGSVTSCNDQSHSALRGRWLDPQSLHPELNGVITGKWQDYWQRFRPIIHDIKSYKSRFTSKVSILQLISGKGLPMARHAKPIISASRALVLAGLVVISGGSGEC